MVGGPKTFWGDQKTKQLKELGGPKFWSDKTSGGTKKQQSAEVKKNSDGGTKELGTKKFKYHEMEIE